MWYIHSFLFHVDKLIQHLAHSLFPPFTSHSSFELANQDFSMEVEVGCLSIALMIIKKETWLLVDTRNKKILGRRKKKHRQMLKGKLDTSTKDNGSTSCAICVNNVSKNGHFK